SKPQPTARAGKSTISFATCARPYSTSLHIWKRQRRRRKRPREPRPVVARSHPHLPSDNRRIRTRDSRMSEGEKEGPAPQEELPPLVLYPRAKLGTRGNAGPS